MYCLVFLSVDSSIPSKQKDSVTLTCQLTDASEVTKYEWVQMVYDLNGTQSVGSIQKGKTLKISKVSDENWGEWACRFHGKEGILGNVTYHIPLMSKLSLDFSLFKCFIIKSHIVTLCLYLTVFIGNFFFPRRWSEWRKVVRRLT